MNCCVTSVMCRIRRRGDLHRTIASCQRAQWPRFEERFGKCGCGLNLKQMKEHLKNTVGKQVFPKQVGMTKLKQEIAEALRMKAVVSVDDRVEAGSDRV